MKINKLLIGINGANGIIGSAIKKELELNENYKIYSIKKRIKNTKSIIDEIQNFDIFINNVYDHAHDQNQLNLLFELYTSWREDNRLIINIGSRSYLPNISKGFKYSTFKNALNHFSDLVTIQDINKKCRITTINPGYVREKNKYALSPIDVAKTIKWIIELPSYIEISRIDLNHKAPYLIVQKSKEKI
jgi:NADP-dependent 3-hydroxy acid dehydrogenase YdfG